MVATNPFTGEQTTPTKIEGSLAKGDVEFPNDPHIQPVRAGDGKRPQTLHSGYSQGGTSNPPAGDDGGVHFYAPKDRKEGGVGKEEATAEKQQERDAEVNPAPHAAAEGRFGHLDVEEKKASKS